MIELLFACTIATAETIRYDRGGNLATYMDRFDNTREIRIDGPCQSACTLALAHPNVCATSRASFAFHAPRMFSGEPLSGEALLREYPPRIQRWIRSNGGLTQNLIYLRGHEMLNLVKRCP